MFIGVFLGLVVIGLILIWADAQLGWHLTTVEEGSMKFVVKGEDYVRTLLNVRGKRMSDDEEKILNSPPIVDFSLVRLLGFHWISWRWPFTRLHRFNLITGALLAEQDRKDKPMKDWVYAKSHPNTDRLDLRIQSYGTVTEVELKDKFNVDLLIFALFEVTDPRLAIFLYKADFIQILNSAILSGYVDKLKDYTYTGDTVNGTAVPGFIGTPKGRGSTFSEETCKYINTGGGKNAPSVKRLQTLYGVKLVETFVYDFQLSAKQDDVVKATRAREVARLNAEAEVEKAKGDAAAIDQKAGAEANRIKRSVEALTTLQVGPDNASRDYATIRSTEAGAGSQTWVQAGAVSVNIPTSSPDKGGTTP